MSALLGVAAIFCVVAVGFLAAKRGHLSPETETSLTVLTLTYSIPALIFSTTVEQLSLEMLKEELGWYIGLPFLIILSGYALARMLGAVLRLSKVERGASSALFAMANVIFIGLPVCLAIFGEWSLPYVIAYVPANTMLFWTIGNIGMMPTKRFKVKELLKQILSPPLTAFLLALIFTIFSISLPDFLILGMKMLGGMATPVALLIVGTALYRMDIRKMLIIPKTVALILIGRCAVMPLLAYIICRIFNAPQEMTIIFTVISAMPAMTQAVLVARRYNTCADEVAHAFTLTTLFCMLCVPLIVLILGLL
jgi:hypothetical protein